MTTSQARKTSKQTAPTALPAFRFTPEQRRSLLDLIAVENAVQLEAFVDLLEARAQRFESRLFGFGQLPAVEKHFCRAEKANQQPLDSLVQFRRETYRAIGLCDPRALSLFTDFCVEVAHLWKAATGTVLPMLPHDESAKDKPASAYAEQHVLCLIVDALDLPITVDLVSTFLLLIHEQ